MFFNLYMKDKIIEIIISVFILSYIVFIQYLIDIQKFVQYHLWLNISCFAVFIFGTWLMYKKESKASSKREKSETK